MRILIIKLLMFLMDCNDALLDKLIESTLDGK
jgi:hypothetical protein